MDSWYTNEKVINACNRKGSVVGLARQGSPSRSMISQPNTSRNLTSAPLRREGQGNIEGVPLRRARQRHRKRQITTFLEGRLFGFEKSTGLSPLHRFNLDLVTIQRYGITACFGKSKPNIGTSKCYLELTSTVVSVSRH